MKWTKKDLAPEEVRALAQGFGLDLLQAAVLVRRGVQRPEDLAFFLEEDLRYTHNPFLFSQMEDVVDRLLAARDDEEQVLIYGDRDADGITSTVILVESFRRNGLNPEWRLPAGDEPYGLTEAAVRDFAGRGGTLIVTVDCGISNFKEIDLARDLGVDVLVFDHHAAPDALPPALAIINPKVPGERYPWPHLAACGVAAKVAWALRFASLEHLYNHPFCLLHVRELEEGGPGLEVEAVRLINLLPAKSLRLIFRTEDPRAASDLPVLVDFLRGQEILVWGAAVQKERLQRLFGRAEIHLTDMAVTLAETFPALRGQDLAGVRARSRMVRYRSGGSSDLDVLTSLFISYLYKSHPVLAQEYQQSLDLVALGTLADLMPLENENRILVKQGMQVLLSGRRPALQMLLAKQGLSGKRVSTADVSWYLIPLINASGRLGHPQVAADLLLSAEAREQDLLVGALWDLNKERRQLSEGAWDSVLAEGRRSYEVNGRMAVVKDASLPRGITGLLAGRLLGALGAPALVMTAQNEGWVASLRVPKGFETRRFLESFADLFTDFGGHDAAAGFHLPQARLEEFQTRLPEVLPSFSWTAGEEELSVDAELTPDYMTPALLDLVDLLEPYGEGNRPLVLVLRQAAVETVELVGKNGARHLKLLINCGSFKWPAMYWNGAEKAEAGLVKAGERLDLAFHVGRNFYSNREGIQLTLLDLRRPGTALGAPLQSS